MIGAYWQRQFIAPMRFEGFCDTSVFLIWLEKVLSPCLKPGQVFVIDNASFHKSDKITQLLETATCSLLFLPTYSPDLNPIEYLWAHLKSIVRKIHDPDANLEDSIDRAVKVLLNN